MLRGLVAFFLLLNAALFFWMRSDPRSLQADREPQRIDRQVAPDAIQVLPDLPPASPAPPSSSTSGFQPPLDRVAPGPAAVASSAARTPTGNVDPNGALAHKIAATEAVCVESGPLSSAQWLTLTQALAQAGVPAEAIAERRQQRPGRWIVYMGRYADAQQWQHKADELKRLGLRFERVSAPPGLDPGLSLGGFQTATDAGTRLDELTRRGVHTARVVETARPTVVRRLQVRANGDRWRGAVGDQRFSACPVGASSSL